MMKNVLKGNVLTLMVVFVGMIFLSLTTFAQGQSGNVIYVTGNAKTSETTLGQAIKDLANPTYDKADVTISIDANAVQNSKTVTYHIVQNNIKSLTICSHGSVTRGLIGVRFDIQINKPVTFKNLLFAYCNTKSVSNGATTDGGAIAYGGTGSGKTDSVGDLTVTNCIFNNCTCTGKKGGAIAYNYNKLANAGNLTLT
jgi:hypothetical protein